MISRRYFVGSSVAGCVASAIGASGWSRASSAAVRPGGPDSGTARAIIASERLPLYAAFFDERFAPAVHFGSIAQRRGLPARAVRGDMTDLWYRELEPLWRREPRPIAGLTAYAALFCLERLAWDHGMRVVFHGTHDRIASGAVQHVIRGPWKLAPTRKVHEGPEAASEAAWPKALAVHLARQDQRLGWTALPPALCATATRVQTPGAPLGSGFEQRLHSWVIARAARERERT